MEKLNRILLKTIMETPRIGKTSEVDSDIDVVVLSKGFRPAHEYSQARCNIPKRYKDTTLSNILKRGVPESAMNTVAVVEKYIKDIDRHLKEGTGLFMRGPVGTMKTTLAVAVMRAAEERGWNTYFVPMSNLVDRIFSLTHDERKEFEHMLTNSDLLVIDDLGMEYEKDKSWVAAKIRAIVNDRYNNMKATIVTTNLGKEAKDRYIDGMLDRIRSTSIFLNFHGNSLREDVNG